MPLEVCHSKYATLELGGKPTLMRLLSHQMLSHQMLPLAPLIA